MKQFRVITSMKCIIPGLAGGERATEANMVVLNRIYTRTGDDGTTGLASGERRKKFDVRIEAYGTVDETNACIGLARLHLGNLAEIDAMLARIQNDLFDLGADLATPEGKPLRHEPLRIVQAQVDRLEREIDALNANLAPLRSFVLPGGTPAGAALHLARTVCRRAERLVVALAELPEEKISPVVSKYLNRLSDFLFVASRAANDNGGRDVLWVPGQNR
jgi:cob(I)alamin adenosyltransferase